MLGITLTTPLVMAVGMVTQLPIAGILDIVLHGQSPDGPAAYCGFVLVMCGFGIMAHLRMQDKDQE